MIHRRSGPAQTVQQAKAPPSPHAGVPAATPPRPAAATSAPAAPAEPSSHDAEAQSIRQRIGPIASQNYYQLLRVTPGSDPQQVERAYRFLLRRVEQETEDPGWRATKALLHEAFLVLRDPERAARYAELVARSEKTPAGFKERLAFEAEPKVDRAVRAMAEGRTGEAAFMLMWAEKLDGTRPDVPVHRAVLDFLRVPRAHRGNEARGLQAFLAQELARQPHDWRIKCCQAFVLAELADARGAQALLLGCPEPDHPMVRLVHAMLRGTGG